MRPLFAILILALGAGAQVAVAPRWFRTATGMLGQAPAGISALEVERLGRYLTFGAPFCGALTPREYASNRNVSQRMTAFLRTVGSTAADMDARAAAGRVAAAFSAFPCAYPGQQMPVAEPAPPPQPGDPPFALKAPDVGKVPDEEQEAAADALIRYDNDAGRSAITWKNAETTRLNLEARGMSLNAQTAAALARLGPLYDEAAAALKAHKWDDALSTLQAAEATTQKIATVVGR